MHTTNRSKSLTPGLILVLSVIGTLTGCDIPLMEGETGARGSGSGSDCQDCLDFNVVTTSSYANEDSAGDVEVADAGMTLVLTNNTWRQTDRTFEITADTVLEFDYESRLQGEIHGIGFDENNDCCDNLSRVFKLYGTQTWGIGDFDSYVGIGKVHYRIPVGQHYTGAGMRLVFSNDNDGGAGNESRFSNVKVVGSATQLSVSGDVGATNSNIVATNWDGEVVWTGSSSNSANYAVEMANTSSDFPLTIRATGGTELVSGISPEFEMQSTILRSDVTTSNINAYSTIISSTASQQARGVNESSIASATQVVLERLNFGIDSARLTDPITSPIQNSNAATLFRSNEAIAEMIRRTSSALLLAGFAFTADQTIVHLSGDLTDGVIDGRGINSDARVAATSSLVSAQILLETMTNDLQVGGFDAESRIDAAILVAHPQASALTSDLTVPSELIDQATVTIAAAYDLSPTAENAALFDAVSAMPIGTTALTALQILPSGASSAMAALIASVASGTASDHEIVNARMRNGVNSNVTDNTPPVLSLVGPSTVPLSVGGTYVEQGATATDDRDGDLTSFVSIDNQSVNTSVASDYLVSYNVSDFSGNAADEITRTVSVSVPNAPDVDPPVISLIGSNPMGLIQGDAYLEPGATASDNVDGDISSRIAIDNSAVATSTVGNYQVTYNVSDTAGNAAIQRTRSVNVQSAPVSSGNSPWEDILNEAVGFGANVTGGKGRPLVTVTNLNDSGSGSLRQAIANNPGGAWIRFAQSLTGTINSSSPLTPPDNTTIDGRGANIVLNGPTGTGSAAILKTSGTNVAIMYVKVGSAFDGMRFGYYNDSNKTNIALTNIWIHHVSFIGPPADEHLDFSPHIQWVTVSWSSFQNHSRGWLIDRHGQAGIPSNFAGIQPLHITSHHNQFTNIKERAPIAVHSRLHSFNNLHEFWGDAAVTGQEGGTEAGNLPGIVFEKSIGDAAGAQNSNVARPHEAGNGTVAPALRSVGPHLLRNGARVTEKNTSNVFDPSSYYSYTADDADAALEANIRANTGWQNVPFPE